MALTISLNLEAATWGDLRAYVKALDEIPDNHAVGHSVTNSDGDIDPELFETR